MAIDTNLLSELIRTAEGLTSQIEVERAKKDPYYFLTHFCYTMDEHKDDAPFQLIPKKEYVRDLCDLFISQDLLAVEKSRQMMVSWIMCSLMLWFAMFYRQDATRIFVMSKKEKDANALIDRIKVIYEHLPQSVKDLNPADPFTYNKMEWSKRKTIIQGVAQGEDQIRSFTSSLIFMDEAAFQEKAEKVYEAAKPSLVGGGKFIAVSTPNGKNFFWRIVKDSF